jgi:hypothetical protein
MYTLISVEEFAQRGAYVGNEIVRTVAKRINLISQRRGIERPDLLRISQPHYLVKRRNIPITAHDGSGEPIRDVNRLDCVAYSAEAKRLCDSAVRECLDVHG